MYSQRNEDEFLATILPEQGRYLSIGEFDGKTFSNIRLFAEKGWDGVCVEPAAHAFAAMVDSPPPNAILVNALVGSRAGLMPLYYSKDTLSTTQAKHARRWESVAGYVPTYCVAVTIRELLETFPGPFDLISVDTEGTTLEIVEELRGYLDALKTKCIVFEHDGVTLTIPGFTEALRTEENSILVRA